MTKIMVDEDEYEELKTKVDEIEKRLYRIIELIACDRLGIAPTPEEEEEPK